MTRWSILFALALMSPSALAGVEPRADIAPEKGSGCDRCSTVGGAAPGTSTVVGGAALALLLGLRRRRAGEPPCA